MEGPDSRLAWWGTELVPSSHSGQRGQERVCENSADTASASLKTPAPEASNQGADEELGFGAILVEQTCSLPQSIFPENTKPDPLESEAQSKSSST